MNWRLGTKSDLISGLIWNLFQLRRIGEAAKWTLLGETKLSRVCKDVGVIEWKLWRNEKLIVPGIYQVPFFLECSHFHIFNPHRVENTVLFPILFFWGILAFQRYKITINYFQSKFTVSVFYQNTLVFPCTPFSREMIYIFFFWKMVTL